METTLLSWTEENSQISQLNNADGKTMEVSDDLAADLEKIRQLSQDSDGAFDPPWKIIRLWDIAGENLMSQISPKSTPFFRSGLRENSGGRKQCNPS